MKNIFKSMEIKKIFLVTHVQMAKSHQNVIAGINLLQYPGKTIRTDHILHIELLS